MVRFVGTGLRLSAIRTEKREGGGELTHSKALDIFNGLLANTLAQQDNTKGSPNEEKDSECDGDEPV